MKKHKCLFLALGFLIISGIATLFFTETFSSDFTLFMGFGFLPVSAVLSIGFFISWIFDIFRKNGKTPVLMIVFLSALLGAAITAGIATWDILYSSDSFFPGLFGMILFIFALPPLAVAVIIPLAIMIAKKCKIKIKEKEDKNV